MKLSISNIAWDKEQDKEMYEFLKELEFSALEIAPTRIFPENPYNKTQEAKTWSVELKDKYGLEISSMQSIWFGRKENIFASNEERLTLIDYTKKAIEFAETIGCKNLVFGCPKNRFLQNENQASTAVVFFEEIADYALKHNTVIGMEANPVIYNTNFINETSEALELIKKVNSDGFKLNLDIGTMLYNNEDVSVLKNNEKLINHVHVSEIGLKPIEKRSIHKEIANILKNSNYNNHISIEMAKTQDFEQVKAVCRYLREVFK